jgi:protein TonB
MDSSDRALIPASDAILGEPEGAQVGSNIAVGTLVNKVAPIYPGTAKAAREQGTVLLGATVGTDGKVHDLEVICSPSKLLDDSALEAVSHWEYKPYTVDGKPVEVETTISVIFAL